MKDNLFSISVVIATYNSERTLEKCLKSIVAQQYPNEKIEIIIVDGSSNDKTLSIAQKYNTRIISVPPEKQNAEYNKGIGVNKAKNDIIFLLDHDNILPHIHWFLRMMKPFLDNQEIVGVEPLRFHYDRKMDVVDRYFALIGGPDPVPYYFGKNSHLSWAYETYNLAGTAKDMGSYYLVKFSPENIPALGGNGAAVRSKFLLENAKVSPKSFFHIDVHVDLIKNGYNTYGIVKDTIIHLTNNKFFPFLGRRKYFIEKYHFLEHSKRRYSIYEPQKDRMKLIMYIIISLTIVKPLYDWLRGYMKVHDPAWFIHPVMCFCMLFVYGIPTIKYEFNRIILGK